MHRARDGPFFSVTTWRDCGCTAAYALFHAAAHTMLTLHRATFASPLGKLVLLADEAGALRSLDWFDCAERMHALLDRHYRRGGWRTADTRTQAPESIAQTFADSPKALRAYFDGELDALKVLPRSTGGSDFQQQVWRALESIEGGRVLSYSELAAKLSASGSVRAIANAVAANPLCLLRPCHRVVGAGGALGGYSGGIERKRWLLEHEGLLPRLAHGASGRATRL
jgi:methylated-DNA-[protein]-cysteine S-methyltransferase